jgi:hypothetical protein
LQAGRGENLANKDTRPAVVRRQYSRLVQKVRKTNPSPACPRTGSTNDCLEWFVEQDFRLEVFLDERLRHPADQKVYAAFPQGLELLHAGVNRNPAQGPAPGFEGL